MIRAFAAIRRNTIGPALIVVQVTLTLTILINALFSIHERLAAMARPTGIDESKLLVMQNNWLGAAQDIPSRVQSDLAALRSLPGVVDAYETNSYPLSGVLWGAPVTLHPDNRASGKGAAVYLGGPDLLKTLGLRLIAGRNLRVEDVQNLAGAYYNVHGNPGGVLVTRQLAESLAPHGNVLGRILTIKNLGGHTSAPIVGIVQNLQVARVDVPELRLAPYSSVMVPYRDTAATAYYVIRATTAAQLSALRNAATASLYAISRARVIRNVESLSDARRRIYRADRAIVILLTTVSVMLMAMTGWGVVGLSSCSVNQRRRQIGIRRALGATHATIVRHFQTENLRIVSVGALAGVGLAVAVNLWMVRHFQMDRLDYRYVLLGAFIVLVLGQLATLWPALRAGSVPPAEVARRL